MWPGAKLSIEHFAPPGLSFAPPIFEDTDKPLQTLQPVGSPDNPTGEDAYARRMRLSQVAVSGQAPDPHRAGQQIPPPPPSPPQPRDKFNPAQPPPPPTAKASAATSISRAPVRYNLPAAPSEIPVSEAELEVTLQAEQAEEEAASDAAPRSLRPGQKGFAERLMSKYGWSKGSGLGASESGIVNPLRVQVEKQKKKPDSEGGGFVGPGGRGKIIGGKRRGGTVAETEEGKFGPMSEVVILRGMVDGMDLDAEMEGAGDGGLMQEIGEECGEKVSTWALLLHTSNAKLLQYGRVERVYIDRSNRPRAPVFVKFTSQLSALRVFNIFIATLNEALILCRL